MTEHLEKIPVIDLFAGPGGLAEGFSAFRFAGGNRFRVCLSIEKDQYAHSTLELRSFFRQFPKGVVKMKKQTNITKMLEARKSPTLS
jgi:site-specific DNA-cytosine methylase